MLFSVNENTYSRGTVESLTQKIDQMNEDVNSTLFSKSLLEVFNKQEYAKSSFKGLFKKYLVFKLNRTLKNINGMDQNVNPDAEINKYELDILVDRLLKYSFLSDSEQIKQLSIPDRAIFLSAQRAALSKGLENYLSKDTRFKKESKFKILSYLLIPFKDEYLRWSYALLMAPKLKGSVLPMALAQDILINGIEKNRDALKPYIKTTYGKYAFNKLSSFYNWFIVISLASIIPVGVYKYNEAVETGQKQAVMMLQKIADSTHKSAQTDFKLLEFDLYREQLVYNLEIKKNRKLTADELSVVDKYVAKKYKLD